MTNVIDNSKHFLIGAEHVVVVRTFGIGLNKAKKTLNATTQKGVRTAHFPLTRRYRDNEQKIMEKIR